MKRYLFDREGKGCFSSSSAHLYVILNLNGNLCAILFLDPFDGCLAFPTDFRRHSFKSKLSKHRIMTRLFSGTFFGWSKNDEQQQAQFFDDNENIAAGSDATSTEKGAFSDTNLSNDIVEEEVISIAPTCLSFEEEDVEERSHVSQPLEYLYRDHAEYLFLRRDKMTNHFYCDVSHFFVESRFLNLVTEFCSIMSLESLNDLFVGLEAIGSGNTSDNDSSITESPEPLPMRVLTMRLRPDTIGSKIMDAVHSSCGSQPNSTVTVIKRGKNGCQYLISSTEGTMTIVSSFLLDARICTRRQSPFERELVIRIFPGERIDDAVECSTCTTTSEGDLMSPMNARMQEAAAFVKRIEDLEKESPCISIYDLPCPQKCPDKFSAMLATSTATIDDSPFLQSPNQMVMEHSLYTILRTWKLLSTNLCTFHTLDKSPLIEQSATSPGYKAPVFDPTYCSQLSLLSQEETALSVGVKTVELEETLERHHEQHQIFKKFIHAARKKHGTWETAELDLDVLPRPEMHPFKLSTGYTFLAMKTLREMQCISSDSSVLADEAVTRVYQACREEGDKVADEYLDKAEEAVVKEMVDIQTAQVALLLDIEYDPETQKAGREFGRRARQSINLRGRVERRLKGRVPMLSFRCWRGECIITSTAMLCVLKHAFQETVELYDLKAISLEKPSSKTVLVTAVKDGETLYTIESPKKVNVDELLQFVTTLQGIQSYFTSTSARRSHEVYRL